MFAMIETRNKLSILVGLLLCEACHTEVTTEDCAFAQTSLLQTSLTISALDGFVQSPAAGLSTVASVDTSAAAGIMQVQPPSTQVAKLEVAALQRKQARLDSLAKMTAEEVVVLKKTKSSALSACDVTSSATRQLYCAGKTKVAAFAKVMFLTRSSSLKPLAPRPPIYPLFTVCGCLLVVVLGFCFSKLCHDASSKPGKKGDRSSLCGTAAPRCPSIPSWPSETDASKKIEEIEERPSADSKEDQQGARDLDWYTEGNQADELTTGCAVDEWPMGQFGADHQVLSRITESHTEDEFSDLPSRSISCKDEKASITCKVENAVYFDMFDDATSTCPTPTPSPRVSD